MIVCPAVLVPAEKWSGQVECWWGLRVAVSWRSGTATEPASEPRSAGESSAAAHSHCEPRPCLKKAQVRGGYDVKRSGLSCPDHTHQYTVWSFVHKNTLTTHPLVYWSLDISSVLRTSGCSDISSQSTTGHTKKSRKYSATNTSNHKTTCNLML